MYFFEIKSSVTVVNCEKVPQFEKSPQMSNLVFTHLYFKLFKFNKVNLINKQLFILSNRSKSTQATNNDQLKTKFETISSLASSSKSNKRLKSDMAILDKLYTDCTKLSSVAHLYDLNDNYQVNGIRSYLQKIDIYFDKIAHLADMNAGNSTKSRNLECYLDILPVLDHELKALNMIHKMRNGNIPIETDINAEIEILKFIMDNLTASKVSAYGNENVRGFYLPESFKKIASSGEKLFALFLFPKWRGILGLLNKKYMQNLMADYYLAVGLGDMKKSDVILKKLLSKSKPKPQPFTVTELELSPQKDWTIDPSTGQVVNTIGTNKVSKRPIKLSIFKPNEVNTKNPHSVILHIHGGGFAIGGHLLYRNVNSSLMKNINSTMVFVDYGLAPETKYPYSLQECLDTYIWLARAAKSNQVLPELGFAPSDIVITGDSAGGNLTLATCIAIAEINRQSNAQSSLHLPKASVPVYPVASASFGYTNPSSVLICPVVTFSSRHVFPAAYVPNDHSDDLSSYLMTRKPTWLQSKSETIKVYEQIYKWRKQPLYQIINYQHFDQLSQVPLHLISGKFDSLFDDSIDVGRVWKGPVTLDSFNLPHGFAMRESVSPECKEAVNAWHKRIKQALAIE